MGPPSAAPRGGHRPWQGLLITASLLTFWHPPTTVQFTIEALPSSAAEGKDVLLLACNISETIQAYYWHKGKTAEGSPLIAGYITDIQANIPGAAYSGRETVYPNGSLLFQNITLEDAGSYTLRTINASYDSDQATGQLHVHRPASSVTSGSSRPQPPPLAMVPLTDPPSRPLYPAPEQPLPSMRSIQVRGAGLPHLKLMQAPMAMGQPVCSSPWPTALSRLQLLHTPGTAVLSPSLRAPGRVMISYRFT
ncbi:cell adhesion molecule CEACAM4 isoform X28 [Homo sapiens]|uniref:cell adhesion molecule CEACAM4 isoform X28 n=1 Tax=Homo sapiens TaxID=9606 RepID=UPI0005CFFEE9|nr:carcinoembryonic antigen-related cell adhesion molecule 4 isoform X28 [Homo sapiens]|eukprot:XP_011524651.1 carcinoembryonic antigen-related cell adhesion molecule 4 isoform X16 [Homo sapiens]